MIMGRGECLSVLSSLIVVVQGIKSSDVPKQAFMFLETAA